MTTATTILQQLGGARFQVMTGASGFAGDATSLSFKLPAKAGFVRNGIRGVRVILTAADDYTVEFYAWKKRNGVPEFKTVSTHEGVYAENLRELFTHATGLDTNL